VSSVKIDPRPYEAALRQAAPTPWRTHRQKNQARSQERRYRNCSPKNFVSKEGSLRADPPLTPIPAEAVAQGSRDRADKRNAESEDGTIR